jgi:hypothetical protein
MRAFALRMAQLRAEVAACHHIARELALPVTEARLDTLLRDLDIAVEEIDRRPR